MKTATKKQIKRSSPLSDSRVVNRRGFERTRGVCGRLWVSKLGRHPPQGTHWSTMVEGLSFPPQTNAELSEQHVTELLIACFYPPPSPPTSLHHTHTSFSVIVSPSCPPHLSPLPPIFRSLLPFLFPCFWCLFQFQINSIFPWRKKTKLS